MDTQSHSARCHKVAAFMEEAAPKSRDPALLRLCAGYLSTLTAQSGDLVSPYTRRFRDELDQTVSQLARDAPAEPDDLYDSAFSLLECAAVLCREEQCREGNVDAARQPVLDYFEQSGHWAPNDGTLASHFYYSLLPTLAGSALLRG